MLETSPLQGVHAEAGGIFTERSGRSVVASYGDPAAEYAASLEGAGLIDLAERGALEVSGPKRLEFLQGLLSNDVARRQPGQGCRAAMMTAKGHLRLFVRALVEKNVVRLETNAEQLESLQGMLEHYRVAAPVRFKRLPATVLGLIGMGSAEILRGQGLESPLAPDDHSRGTVAGREILVARAGDLPGGGFVLHVDPEDVATVWEALVSAGARPVGREALDARRVEDRRPWYGIDVTEENLLHETGLLAEYHSSTKGCYVGQEVVARLEARGGNVNKMLCRLRLSAPSRIGATVRGPDKDAGQVTTAAVSPRVGPIALAWVHRSLIEPGTEVHVDGATATVVADFEGE